MNDIKRTIVVISQSAALSDILREVITPQQARVFRTSPERAEHALQRFTPWPFAIATDTAGAVPAITKACADHPILVFWLGEADATLPSHAVATPNWRELLAAVETALANQVAGLKLAAHRGISTPDGGFLLNPKLEALIAQHPRPLCVSWRGTAGLNRVLARTGSSVRVHRQDGVAVLKPRLALTA